MPFILFSNYHFSFMIPFTNYNQTKCNQIQCFNPRCTAICDHAFIMWCVYSKISLHICTVQFYSALSTSYIKVLSTQPKSNTIKCLKSVWLYLSNLTLYLTIPSFNILKKILALLPHLSFVCCKHSQFEWQEKGEKERKREIRFTLYSSPE